MSRAIFKPALFERDVHIVTGAGRPVVPAGFAPGAQNKVRPCDRLHLAGLPPVLQEREPG